MPARRGAGGSSSPALRASLRLVADVTVALLGGGLKVKQKITGRMADALAELYLLSCILKRYEDDGCPRADQKLVDYCAENASTASTRRLPARSTISRLRWGGLVMRPLVFPYGFARNPASDKDGKAIVRAALQPGELRDRLTRDIFITDDPKDRVGLLEHTLLKVVAAEEADKKLERAIRKGEVRRVLQQRLDRRGREEGHHHRRRSARARRGPRSHRPRDRRRSFRCRRARARPADCAQRRRRTASSRQKTQSPPNKDDHADAAPHTCTTGASPSTTRASPGRSWTAKASA